MEDLWGRALYDCSLVIEKAEDLQNIRSLLEKNYREISYFNDFNDDWDASILDVVYDTAVCDDFDPKIIRKALELGFYPLATTRRICHRRELPKRLAAEYDDAFFENLKDIPVDFSETGGFNRNAAGEAGEEIDAAENLRKIPPFFRFCVQLLTIRYHSKKLIIFFNNFRIPKKVPSLIKKRFADYTLTFNKNFSLCMEELKNTYRNETWLYPLLVEQFTQINQNPDESVSVDSVEIWHDGELVAGEFGFVTGNVYASLSGFHKEDDIGTVQMVVLGLYLKKHGFAYWDLGMELDYKYRFGAVACNWDEQDEAYARTSRRRIAFCRDEIPLTDFLSDM